MAADLNSVTLVGRLAQDPDLRSTAGGMTILKLRLAWSTRAKDPSGQWGEKSNYIDVTCFGDRYERLAQYLEKGRRVGVTGRLEMDEWERDGQRRSSINVIASDLQFLDSRGEGQGQGGYGAQAAAAPRQGSDITPNTDDFVPVGAGSGANDDDIPF